jgi:hypothetical protein
MIGAALAAVGTPLAACSSDHHDEAAPAPPTSPVDASDSTPLPAVDAGGTDSPPDSTPPLPSLAALNARDDIWLPLADGGRCHLREGKVNPDPFPKRAWSSCGNGCRTSPAALQFDAAQYVEPLGPAGAYFDGDTYLMLESENTEALGRTIRVERLSDGVTVAAVLDRGPRGDSNCHLAWRGGAAPLLFDLFDGQQELFGRASETPGAPIVWQEHWVTLAGLANERFSSDIGYGHSTYAEIQLFPDKSYTVPVSLSPGSQLAHGYGAQFIWGYSNSGSIRSFTVGPGAVDLIALVPPRVPMGARLSDSRIVWIDGTRPGDEFADAQWHWSPRATQASDIVIQDGPPIPIVGQLLDMQTTGEWVAAYGEQGADKGYESRVFVWNMTSGQTYVVPNRRADRTFTRVFAVTPTELILGEQLLTDSFHLLDQIVRIDLAALPSLVAQWPK